MSEICIHCGSEIKTKVDDRSLKELRTYWACIGLIVEHKSVNDAGEIDYEWNTKDKVHAQVRYACKYINRESAVHFQTATGSKLYFELKSIAFDKANHKESHQYIADAISFMSGLLGITSEELIEEVKARMQP